MRRRNPALVQRHHDAPNERPGAGPAPAGQPPRHQSAAHVRLYRRCGGAGGRSEPLDSAPAEAIYGTHAGGQGARDPRRERHWRSAGRLYGWRETAGNRPSRVTLPRITTVFEDSEESSKAWWSFSERSLLTTFFRMGPATFGIPRFFG